MKNKKMIELNSIIQNCLNRGCTSEEIQDFIDRARLYNIEQPEMIPIIDDLEVRYIASLGEGKEV
ncbi:hypothetical protein [Paenibacillus sp. FSL H7-0323]|uniref:hypothetical protein n=1 Tax=Paenibacillus sp. FSL H7-0323 TaxID=2921433 RepID=UPI0030FCA314